MMKKFSHTFIFLALLLGAFYFFFWKSEKSAPPVSESEGNRILISNVTRLVKQHYVEEIPVRKKFDGAYSTLLSALDSRSAYLDPQMNKKLTLLETGEIHELGIRGIVKNGYFSILGTVAGSPAATAPLEPGDLIREIGSRNLFGRSRLQMLLLQTSLSPATLHIKAEHPKTGKAVRLTLNTKKTNLAAVPVHISRGITYFKLPLFSKASTDALRNGLNPESGYWIIDLRNYIYGNFTDFKNICNLLLPHNTPISVKEKEQIQTILTEKTGWQPEKMAVLIDGSTAMYGEVLAFLLKKNKIPLIGMPSSGFNSRTETFSLGDRSTVILTVGYFLDNSKPISSTPVRPDFSCKTGKEMLSLALKILKK